MINPCILALLASTQPQLSPAAGYRAWYRGDQYAAGTWTDLSANGYNLSGGTAPTAVSSDANFNSKPVVDFNGTTQYLLGTTMSNLIANNAFTIFGVVRPTAYGTSDTNAGFQRGIISAYNSGNSIGIGMGLTKMVAYGYDGTADYIDRAASLNTVYGFDFRHDSGSIKLLVSGNTETSAASGNSASLTDTLIFGATYDASPTFSGQIAEIIIYNTVLSAGDRTTTQNYLAARYGITW